MKTTTTLTLAALTALTLTACGVDGFADEDTKELAWHAYNCEAYGRIDARSEAISINIDILNDNIPADEIGEAQRWESRLRNADTVGDVIDRSSGDGFTDLCDGWLWERKQNSSAYWEGYDDFDYDQAVEAGIVSGQ